jgi:hypothetical protein
VISCIALLLAAGGTSFAAITATGNAVNITDPVTAANKAKVGDRKAPGHRERNGRRTAGGADHALVEECHRLCRRPVHARRAQVVADQPHEHLDLSAQLRCDDRQGQVLVMAYHVPSSATTCASPTLDGLLWDIPRLTASAPFAASFPTPLQVVPPAGTKACLLITVVGTVDVTINASGFVS